MQEKITYKQKVPKLKKYPVTKKKTISKRRSQLNMDEHREIINQLFDNINTCIAIYEAVDNGEDFIFVDLNKAGQKYSKVKKEAVTGKRVTEVFPGVKNLGLFDVLKRVWKSGKPENLPLQQYKDNRMMQWVENYVFRLPSGLIVAMYDDTSDKHKVEEELKINEERFRRFTEASPTGIFLFNSEGDITYVNTAGCNMLGYTESKLLSMNIQDIIQIDYLPDGYKYFEELLIDDKTSATDLKLKKKDGTFIIVILEIIKLSIDEFITYTTDITDIKSYQHEIKLNNERLESLLKISQYTGDSVQELLNIALRESLVLTESKIGAIFLYDKEKNQFILNSYANDIIKEYSVMHHQTFYNLDDINNWGEAVKQRKAFIDNNYPDGNQDFKTTRKSHIVIQKILSIPVLVKNEIVAVLSIANREEDYDQTDINQLTLLMNTVWEYVEQQKRNAELIEAKLKAEESDKLKSAFLANMSHEIRTPMNGIIGFSDMLMRPNLSEEKRYFYSNTIINSGKQLLNVVNDIIDISKIEAGALNLNIEAVVINDLIIDLFSFFEPQLQNKNVSLFPYKKLSDHQSTVFTDKIRLKQILINLINNAFKFTQKGHIFFGYDLIDNTLRFFVEDTGIGIANEMHEKIFEQFRQVEIEMTKQYGGTGLGLSISKKLVELLGGKIWLKSSLNKGSTFYFTIPYDAVDKANIPQKEQLEHNNASFTILVAEDDEINYLYIGEVLIDAPIYLIHARNGKEAVEFCKKNKTIDLVLMDIKMPLMNGYEATHEIKKIRPDLPVIAQTAYALVEDENKALDAGCDGYLSKPINKAELLKYIVKYTKKKQ